jgi:uncharacterized protein YcfL
MKKLFLMFAVVSFLVSCGSSTEETTGTDSTTVVVDSTACDSTHCDTTKVCCKDSAKVDTTAH